MSDKAFRNQRLTRISPALQRITGGTF